MMKRTVHTIAMVLLASPLVLVGCGDSGDDKADTGAGGTGGTIKWDGGAGTGGTVMDGPSVGIETGTPDANLPIDVASPDAPPPVDAGLADVKVVVDAPLADTRPPAVEVQPIEAQPVDTTPAIDTPPVLTCTETTKFSGGTVSTDRTLTKACSPYTIKTDIDVTNNATLTIEAGVTVRFNSDTNIAVGYNSSAKLVAAGTATDPILLTSANTSPGAGDWAGIQLLTNVMNGTSLSHVKFDYCGSNGDACILGSGVKPGRVTLDNVAFAHVGPGSNAIWEKDRDSNFTISNCTFNDIPSAPTQQYAISVYAPSFAGIDSTNTFNGGAMVELMGGAIGTDTTWKNVGTAVAVTDDVDVQGTSTPKLTIAAGSELKFASGTGIGVGYSNPGSLILSGTATARIKLTSLAGTPSAGDWVGIFLWSGGSAKIANTTISYAGSDRGAITVDSNTSSLDIQSSTIDHSGSYGIGVRCNSTAVITNTGNTFTDNASGDVGPGPDGTEC